MASRAKAVVPATPEAATPVVVETDADILVRAREAFTPESAIAAAESPETATAYASDVLTAYVAAEREGVRASVYAAMAAASAVRAGLLSDGPKAKDAGEGVKDAKEWGEAWITPKHPEGVSRQMVDTWIRAGEAFLGWGVDPESPEGKRLLGGLAQGKEWNARRKVIASALAELTEAGETPEPEDVARMATEAIAEVRKEAEEAEAERKAKREKEKAEEAQRVKDALAKKKADEKAGVLPEGMSLEAKRAAGDALIAGMRSSLKAEREILEDWAARIAFALSDEADEA